MQKNVVGQKWIVFAFDSTDNTAKLGDAAQITAKISKDGAAAGGNIADTHPTELEGGYYAFDIAQGESNGDYLLIMPESSTGDIQVIGVPGGVWTTSPQTGDSFARVVQIRAWALGDWQPKSGVPGTYEVLDPDDGVTPVMEVTPDGSSGIIQVVIL